MITKEQLLNTGLKTSLTNYWKGYRELHGVDPTERRHPDTVVGGVIRKAQYQKLVFESVSDDPGKKMLTEGTVCSAHIFLKEPTAYGKNGVYFFTDDATLGYTKDICLLETSDSCFITGHRRVPITVKPCEGLEDGIIDTIDKFIEIFHKNDILIQDIDELLGFINLNRLPENQYDFIERVGKYITTQWGLKDNPAHYTVSHGDKTRQYRDQWEDAGVPFNHGAFIYLMSHISPYSDQVRQTEDGWVDVAEWVINFYKSNPAFVELISNCWDINATDDSKPQN